MPSFFHKFLIWIFTSFNLPITIIPRTYKNVRKDRSAYRPFFNPWRSDKEFLNLYKKVKPFTTLFQPRLYNLYFLANTVLGQNGDVFECGVYRGGSAFVLAELCRRHGTSPDRLHLFDTFSGMPVADLNLDGYSIGSFNDTSPLQLRLPPHDSSHLLSPRLTASTFTHLSSSPHLFYCLELFYSNSSTWTAQRLLLKRDLLLSSPVSRRCEYTA